MSSLRAVPVRRVLLVVVAVTVLLVLLKCVNDRRKLKEEEFLQELQHQQRLAMIRDQQLRHLAEGEVTTSTTPAPPIIAANPFGFSMPPVPTARPFNFEGFNNITGQQEGDFLVPNIVHFMRFKKKEMGFVDFIVILAAFKNQRPDRIMFHTDVNNFTGVYWERLLAAPGFSNKVELVHTELPNDIFGQPFSEGWHLWHASDTVRVRILMRFGGIILDNDSYLVRSLDKFRRYELAMGWDQDQFIGVQVVMAHPQARFLNLWLETYRGAYDKTKWYYNAGQRPTEEVLYKKPELIHRVKLLFGVHYLVHKLYNPNIWAEWRDQYSIHLLIRHQKKEFTEENFMNPPCTFRDMVLDVYDPYTKRARVV